MMVKPINQIRREWLIELREEKGLKTREIAEIIGVSYQHYNDVETGRRNPSIDLSIKLSEFFDIPLKKFLINRTKFFND